MVSKPSRIVYHLVLLTLSDKELNKIQYICILYILKNGDENSLSKCGAAIYQSLPQVAVCEPLRFVTFPLCPAVL